MKKKIIVHSDISNIGSCNSLVPLTHWGRVTHICVGKLTIIGSNNGLSPSRRQAIIWTNAGIMLIGPLGTNFSEILSEIHAFSFNKMHLKVSSAKWRLFCLGLNELIEMQLLKWVLAKISVSITRPQCVKLFPLAPHICISKVGQHWFR